MSYADFLASKAIRATERGLSYVPALAGHLFPFQRTCVDFALRAGSAGNFLSTGLGKTACELEWSAHAADASNGKALILAPLSVGWQIEQEAKRWGYDARVIREQDDVRPGINICNYDRLDKLDPAAFGAVALDESSILKSFAGKTSRALIEAFSQHRFRLSATATPAPNDHMELGQQSDFLGVMPASEMLMRWFINDTSTASQEWRLKKHAVTDFWDWCASWSRMAEMPSDLTGDQRDDDGFVLPPMRIVRHRAEASPIKGADLFGMVDMSATSMHDVKRKTAGNRAQAVADLIDGSDPWVVWVDSDYEADAVMTLLPGAAEVRGSHSPEQKEATLRGFADGLIRVLVTKPAICGFGLNWQHCARTVFVGRTFSYEAWYQAVRRFWRFGQQREVEVHLIVAEGEDAIARVIDRKADDHATMKAAMRAAMLRATEKTVSRKTSYQPNHKAGVAGMGRVIDCLDSASGENWMAYNGDCVSVASQLPDESVGFSIYSPPFQNIFVYSDSEADMGNCASDDEFNRHYSFLIREKLRITKPGRLTAVHCSDLPSSKWKDGVIGLKDFPGDIVRLHQDAGWIFHSRICVWRDPVVEMTRTKALGLLYKQLKKDSTRSRMGMADYVLVFRKPGDNPEPVEHKPANFPVSQWQKWASPVWMDINQTNTLNVRMAKDNADERHLCPLQLDLIERAVTMWSNPGDVVLSPFMGIGSEGVTALKLKRRFIGIELKPSYFKHACRYLEAQDRQEDLFIAELPTMEAVA